MASAIGQVSVLPSNHFPDGSVLEWITWQACCSPRYYRPFGQLDEQQPQQRTPAWTKSIRNLETSTPMHRQRSLDFRFSLADGGAKQK
jgi:hypothetical protein